MLFYIRRGNEKGYKTRHGAVSFPRASGLDSRLGWRGRKARLSVDQGRNNGMPTKCCLRVRKKRFQKKAENELPSDVLIYPS